MVVQDQTEMFWNLNHHPVCAASDAAHFLFTGAATPPWPGLPPAQIVTAVRKIRMRLPVIWKIASPIAD